MCTLAEVPLVMPSTSDPATGPGMAILLADTLAGAAEALVAALDQAGLRGCSVAWEGPDRSLHGPQGSVPAGGQGWPRDAAAPPAPGQARVLCDAPGAAAWLLPAPGASLPAPTPAQQQLLDLGARRFRDLFAFKHLSASVQALAQAEKLQRALFAIADLAGSDRDMGSMLRGLHEIIGQLMYAENLFIALYEPGTDSLRFLYFADTVDKEEPLPGEAMPLSALERGLTWYVVNDCRPLMGSMEAMRRQVSGPLVLHGAEAHDWLGVPMVRDGRAVGVLVVQSYLEGIEYTGSDRAVLAFVAEHVLTAVERKQGQARLEQHVAERTRQLAEANAELKQQVAQRERAQHLQATLYRIAALTNNEQSSEDFYRHVHQAVSELINAENFYIALVAEGGARLDFPYHVDAVNPSVGTRPFGRGITEYVIRHGRPLLLDRAGLEDLAARDEIAFGPSGGYGQPSLCWLGVPLRGAEGVIGAVAVQSYRSDLRYDQSDAELLTFVSNQIANSLQRREHADALRRLNAELEQRVQERTRELREQIAVREQVEARLQHEIMHDPLTGLPNRLYLRDRLERALASQRRNAGQQFALMYLDVDRFKVFNDSLGHLAGDEVLREVARRLQSCVREPDVVARLSGDEFAVLLEHSPLPQTACKVAARIQKALQAPMQVGGRELQASASIGIALGNARHANTDAVLHDADVALYRAKAAGRQRFVLFDETLHRTAMDVLDLEHQLRAALANAEFEPHFQPIVSLADGAVAGYEALVRWRHPARGLLAPGEFLPVAEECGLLEAIDWQLYRAALRQGAPLLRGSGYLTINVSPRHFQDETFDQRLLALGLGGAFVVQHPQARRRVVGMCCTAQHQPVDAQALALVVQRGFVDGRLHLGRVPGPGALPGQDALGHARGQLGGGRGNVVVAGQPGDACGGPTVGAQVGQRDAGHTSLLQQLVHGIALARQGRGVAIAGHGHGRCAAGVGGGCCPRLGAGALQGLRQGLQRCDGEGAGGRLCTCGWCRGGACIHLSHQGRQPVPPAARRRIAGQHGRQRQAVLGTRHGHVEHVQLLAAAGLL
ncbi:MAG: diguanylate cyclase, partial [Rhizobium sp.]|nr:diguanylate cyclase [Rhizobium sp.]